ncbi:alpha/beta hydrolase [Xanthomonadaceae bacterium XH05]|nr:alpha/beta hydrolase [Xanthomonadaceae bacterium XH05]
MVPASERRPPLTDPPIRNVLLLPGIWMRPWTLLALARRLSVDGFAVSMLAYPGVFGGPRPALARLRPALARVDAVVAHSLGGLMVLEALRADPALPVRRVVCLGSPLSGSKVARRLHDGRLGVMLGRSRDLLTRGCSLPWAGQALVGSIAGSASCGFGRMLGGFPGINDGTVGIDETRWSGLADHTVVRASHSGLLLSRDAARQAAHFLRRGQFSHG